MVSQNHNVIKELNTNTCYKKVNNQFQKFNNTYLPEIQDLVHATIIYKELTTLNLIAIFFSKRQNQIEDHASL